jgi:hypothetical protein
MEQADRVCSVPRSRAGKDVAGRGVAGVDVAEVAESGLGQDLRSRPADPGAAVVAQQVVPRRPPAERLSERSPQPWVVFDYGQVGRLPADPRSAGIQPPGHAVSRAAFGPLSSDDLRTAALTAAEIGLLVGVPTGN